MITLDIDLGGSVPTVEHSRAVDKLAAEAMMKRIDGPVDECDRPLCIDLDETLVSTHLLSEYALALLPRSPLKAFFLLFWMVFDSKKAAQSLLSCAAFSQLQLPFRSRLLRLLYDEHQKGRSIFLISSAPPQIGHAVVVRLGFISGAIHLPAEKDQKAIELCKRFGAGNFDYIGHAETDLPIWRTSHAATLVAPSQSLIEDATWRTQTATILSPRPSVIDAYVNALRVPAWLKNGLVFVPLVASANVTDLQVSLKLYLAFVAFCAIASAGYLINDLTDLPSDRQHPIKRRRPITQGRIPFGIILYMIAVLLVIGFSLAAFLSLSLAAWIGAYLATSIVYSLWLKRFVLTDIFVLACLYLYRVIAGYVTIDKLPTLWPALFAGFLSLSLAALHRRLEQKNSDRIPAAHAPQYRFTELQFVTLFGLSAGFLSALITALYAHTASAARTFAVPQLLYLCTPAIVYLVACLWLRAENNPNTEDPFAFTLSTPMSYAVVGFCILVLVAAKFSPEQIHAWFVFGNL